MRGTTGLYNFSIAVLAFMVRPKRPKELGKVRMDKGLHVIGDNNRIVVLKSFECWLCSRGCVRLVNKEHRRVR